MIGISLAVLLGVILVWALLPISPFEPIEVRKNSSRLVDEVVFVNRYDISRSLLGVWEFGYGDSLENFGHRAHRVEFLEDGTVVMNRNSSEFELIWAVDEHDQLMINHWREGSYVYFISMQADVLTLADEDGYVRSWRREGAEETREISDQEEFLGVWTYGLGDSWTSFGRAREIEFFSDGRLVMMTPRGYQLVWSWEFSTNGELMIGSGEVFSVEVEQEQLLVIADEQGNEQTWVRDAGLGVAEDRDWVINEYLDLFDVDEGYHVIDNSRIAGIEFDFVIYEVAPIDLSSRGGMPDEGEHWVVVVLRDSEIVDVLQHYPWRLGFEYAFEGAPDLTEVIAEVDVDFDGRNDVLLRRGGQQGGGSPMTEYVAYLQRDGYLEHSPSFSQIVNPVIDVENQIIFSSWNSFGNVARNRYEFVNGEFIATSYLRSRSTFLVRWLFEETLVDGQWQFRKVCMFGQEICGEELENSCEDTVVTQQLLGSGQWYEANFCQTNGDEFDITLLDRIQDEVPHWQTPVQLFHQALHQHHFGPFATTVRLNEQMPEFTVYRIIGDTASIWEDVYYVQIRIEQDGELIQEIDDLRQTLGGPSGVDSFHDPSLEIRFLDLTGNGYLDMTMRQTWGGSMRNEPHYFWLWDVEAEEFVKNETLHELSWGGHVELNDQGQISVFARVSIQHYGWIFYDYIDGDFVKIGSQIYDIDENGVPIVTIRDYIAGTEEVILVEVVYP